MYREDSSSAFCNSLLKLKKLNQTVIEDERTRLKYRSEESRLNIIALIFKHCWPVVYLMCLKLLQLLTRQSLRPQAVKKTKLIVF